MRRVGKWIGGKKNNTNFLGSACVIVCVVVGNFCYRLLRDSHISIANKKKKTHDFYLTQKKNTIKHTTRSSSLFTLNTLTHAVCLKIISCVHWHPYTKVTLRVYKKTMCTVCIYARIILMFDKRHAYHLLHDGPFTLLPKPRLLLGRGFTIH